MKNGITPTVKRSNRAVIRVNDTTYIGVPKTGYRVCGVGKQISQTPRMKAFRSICG